MVSTSFLIGVIAAAAVVIILVFVARSRGGRGASAGRIVFLEGPRQGEAIELREGRSRIGALEDNDIVIPSKAVSRYHAELRIRNGRVQIWDLKSRNQTYINGESVKTRELEPGDVIRVGDMELRYES